MARRIPTVKIKFKDGFKLINEADFDPKKHKKFKGQPASDNPPADNGEGEPENQQFGDYRIEEKGGGYKNVVHIQTQEVQNEKGLKEDEAIALAKDLAAKDEE